MTLTPIRLTLFAAVLTLLCWNVAAAQNIAPQTKPDTSVWPRTIYTGQKVDLVTFAANGRSISCHVASFDEAQIACSHHRKPVVYRREQIAALVEPGWHSTPVRAFLLGLGAGGGIVTGAIFLSVISVGWAIPVAIIGGLVLLGAGFSLRDGADDVPAKVLYLAPDQDSLSASDYVSQPLR